MIIRTASSKWGMGSDLSFLSAISCELRTEGHPSWMPLIFFLTVTAAVSRITLSHARTTNTDLLQWAGTDTRSVVMKKHPTGLAKLQFYFLPQDRFWELKSAPCVRLDLMFFDREIFTHHPSLESRVVSLFLPFV